MRTIKRTNYSVLAALSAALSLTSVAALAQEAVPAAPIASEPDTKVPAWETSAALGLTLTRGNSETLLFSGSILSEKKWDMNEVRLGADATQIGRASCRETVFNDV